MHFDGKRAKTQWRTLVQKAGESHTELGISLGRAYPVGLDDSGVLTIEFEPGADKAWASLHSPANMQVLESLLKTETDNIVGVQMRKAPAPTNEEEMDDMEAIDEMEDVEEIVEEAKPAMELKEVPVATYDDLLQDAGIAVVVNEFRGTIVAVQGVQKKQKK